MSKIKRDSNKRLKNKELRTLRPNNNTFDFKMNLIKKGKMKRKREKIK